MVQSKAFAEVNTLPKADKKVVNPRATRYGIVPIWDTPTLSKDFYVWKIPANTVFPFRPFIGETVRDINDNVMHVNERLPNEQIIDMHNTTPFFTELTPLATLNDEAKAERIVNVLANPAVCDKYPVEQGTTCATCWFKDSLTKMEDRIRDAFAGESDLRKVATECMAILRESLSKSIEEARRLVDIAIRDIDDPKSGKTVFYDTDYRNVFHTHAERPIYKTTVNAGQNVGAEIAEALKNLIPQKAESPVDVAALVATAVAEATKDLREQLASYQSKEDKKEAIKEKLGKKD